MKKVITFGTFDIIHPGHIHMLKEAKSYGDYLVVVVALNKTIKQVKGRPPVYSALNRLKALTALNIADKVRLGCWRDKYRVIKLEKPDVVALGYDQEAFVDNLKKALEPHVRIVRLSAYQPKKYKSSFFK